MRVYFCRTASSLPLQELFIVADVLMCWIKLLGPLVDNKLSKHKTWLVLKDNMSVVTFSKAASTLIYTLS